MNKQLFKCAMLPIVLTAVMLQSPGVVFDGAVAMAAQQAQGAGISGQVVDASGESVIGASVMVDSAKGVGTVTDIDGNFTLKVKPGTKLRVSYVGYDTQVVAAKQGMKVTMSENNTMLKGVEVVAYGTQKKVTVTGAQTLSR